MKKKQIVSLLLVAAMTLGLTACGDKELVGVRAEEDHDTVSSELYDAALGDFNEALTTASASVDTDERYALMAVAESKLLESGVFLPGTSNGGTYVMSRLAYKTVPSVKYGGDQYRYETAIACNELIKNEDWDALKELYKECKGTGTYHEKAQEYLENAGYTFKDTLNLSYSSDNQTWDLFAEWNATLYEPMALTFDNLMEYDDENVLQPALAESYDETDNGDGTTTITFHLREGVKWVDNQGREYADVTADDWVAGAQHCFDAGSGVEDLYTSDGACIVGADEYYAADAASRTQELWDAVGIKAVDDYTLEYTIDTTATAYFFTMLGYTEFSPLCRDYYKSQGGTFVIDGDEYTSGDYGLDSEHILYCGPYLVSNATTEDSITFVQNPTYWNIDNVTLTQINWLYDDGSDDKATYDNCINSVTDSVGLTPSRIEIAQADGNYDTYAHVSETDATSFILYYNMNRCAFANAADATKLVSEKTQKQVDNAYYACNNQHFRLAMNYALDRVSYNAQVKGDELASNNLVNSYTTGDFVSLSNDTSVEIGGESVTFPAGTYYGEILQAALDADGYDNIKVWDEENECSTGFDGWYNPDKAVEELNLAIEELADEGVKVTEKNPIVLDYPTWTGNEAYANRAYAYKASIEESLGGLVQINIVETSDSNDWYYAEYYVYSGTEENFDIGDMTGWSPDYGDPASMLKTFLPDGSGYCTMSLGLW